MYLILGFLGNNVISSIICLKKSLGIWILVIFLYFSFACWSDNCLSAFLIYLGAYVSGRVMKLRQNVLEHCPCCYFYGDIIVFNIYLKVLGIVWLQTRAIVILILYFQLTSMMICIALKYNEGVSSCLFIIVFKVAIYWFSYHIEPPPFCQNLEGISKNNLTSMFQGLSFHHFLKFVIRPQCWGTQIQKVD